MKYNYSAKTKNKSGEDDEDEGNFGDFCPFSINYERRTRLSVPLDRKINETSYYSPLLTVLRDLDEDDQVYVHLESPGGSVDGALAIIDGLNNTEAHVHIHISNENFSAATIIALSVPYADVTVSKNATMMFHNAGFGTGGAMHNIASEIDFVQKRTNKILSEAYKNFLTKEELRLVFLGTEVRIDADEINRRFPLFLEARHKEMQKEAKNAQITNKSSTKNKRLTS